MLIDKCLYIFDDATHDFQRITAGGSDWDAESYATDLILANLDDDEQIEYAVTRFASSGARVIIGELPSS